MVLQIAERVFAHKTAKYEAFPLISNFHCVLNAFFWVIPQCLFYMPAFQNTLFHLHRWVGVKKYLPPCEDGTDRVFRNVGI